MKTRTIYAYSTSNQYEYRIKHNDIPWLKVGDTERLANDRVHEQDGTSDAEQLEIKKTWQVPFNFRDHNIHKILKKRNVIRLRKNREWFECNIGDIDSAINELLHGIYRRDSFPMREEQEEAVNKAFNYYKNGNEFLFNAKMRYGKTFTSYNLMKKLNAKKTLILTYKPATVDGWESDLNNHVNFVNYNFYKALNYSKENPIILDEGNNVLFASFQDILGKNLNGEVKDKWLEVINQEYDLLIIDEVHFGANSPRAQKLLSSLNVKNVAAMSGTPIKLLMGGVYVEEQIYTWSYVDEQKKRKLEKKNGWVAEI